MPDIIFLALLEEQLDFPVLYASAKEGWASSEYTKSPPEGAKSMSPLLDTIIRHVIPPSASLDDPFQMLVCILVLLETFLNCNFCMYFLLPHNISIPL